MTDNGRKATTVNGEHFQSHYIPNTLEEQASMLATLGLDSIDQLFADIPEQYCNPSLDLPPPLSELEIQRELAALAGRNRPLGSGPSFLGAGSYQHFIPAIVKALITRGEFLTAYTPYQPEASQGTLQVIYEFQTLVCNLFGMEVANAGMYDGATSLAEASLMACRVTRRSKVAVLDTVSPAYAAVIRTYCRSQNIEVVTTPSQGRDIDNETACLVVQYPNFFGYVEDLGELCQEAHRAGALAVVSADPVAFGMFQPPGHYGADIVTGEGQPLGIPTSFGGPYLGLFATRQEHVRQMPSRLAGRTVDRDGATGYVLTLQTRGTTHQTGAGHVQHLHQRGPLRLGFHRLHGGPWKIRPAAGGRALLPQGPLRGVGDRGVGRVFRSLGRDLLPGIRGPMPAAAVRDQPPPDGTKHSGGA